MATMARSTRERIRIATAELMRRKGYGAIGMKDIVTAAGTPIGSLYHHFPGGKSQIAGEALTDAGAAYGELLLSVVDEHADLGVAMAAVFTEAAADMANTDFANMCPVGSVAAEVADTVESLREVSADVFMGWIDSGTAYFTGRGLPQPTARDVTVALICAL